jgi:hypothetical protein
MITKVINSFIDKYTRVRYDKGSAYMSDDMERIEMLRAAGYILESCSPIVNPENVEYNVVPEEYKLKHIGAGYYLLPDGSKVRGKDKALKKLDELMEDE